MTSSPNDSRPQASQVRSAEVEPDNQRLYVELGRLREENSCLRKANARYRQIFENAPISMLCISAEGEATEMNSAAEEFLGWTVAQAKEASFNGCTDSTLIDNGTISSFDRAIAGETVIEPPMHFDPSSTIGQGQWRWAQGHYYPLRDAAGQVQEVVEVALNLTEMYRVQQEIVQNHTRLLSATAQVANLLLRTPDYMTVLPEVVRILGEATGSDRCGVGQDIGLHPTYNRPAVKSCIEWCRSGVPSSLETSLPLDQAFLWDDAPEAYKALARGHVFNRLVADMKEPGRSLMQAQGNTCCLFVPILVEGKLWGLFSFDSCEKSQLYSEAETAILQIAAESLSAAIACQSQNDALRESEHRYRTLFELSSEGICRFGYKQPISLALSVDEQLELCYESIYIAEANDAYAEMYAREKAEDLIGLTLSDFHDRDSEVTQATMRDWIENQYFCHQLETVEFDDRGRQRYFLNSSVSTIEDNCVVNGWVSQIDITELRAIQQALLRRCLFSKSNRL